MSFLRLYSDYDEFVDTSIYGSHLFRLPNQTVVGKTKHVVDGSELKNYVLIASEEQKKH